jgi:nitric oxide reductase activation protein
MVLNWKYETKVWKNIIIIVGHNLNNLIPHINYKLFSNIKNKLKFPKKLIIHLVNVEADPKLPYIVMWWNPAKLYRKKVPKKGRENETKGKDRSPSKETTQQRQGHSEEMEPLRTKPLQCRFENWCQVSTSSQVQFSTYQPSLGNGFFFSIPVWSWY